MSREYKTGTRWCLWRWKHLGYIDRLHLVQTPLFSICLHWINHADPEPWLHDHPVSFLSIVLRGGYFERLAGVVLKPYDYAARNWFNFVRYSTRHRIICVKPGTLTLCFMGPRRQEWGFFAGGKKVLWKAYYVGKRDEAAAQG